MKRYRVTAVIWKEGDRYVSKCPELGVASFGRSLEGARKALEEAVALYIENARTLGMLQELKLIQSPHAPFTSTVEIAVS